MGSVRQGTPIATERLVLRPFRVSDTAAFLAYQADPAVRRHLPGPAMDDAAAQRYVAAQAALTGTERDAWHGWVVEHRVERCVVGDVGAWLPADGPSRGDVGFQFAPAHHRRGYATEAVGALCRHLLGTAGLGRLTASCEAANAGSQAVLRAVGMTEVAAPSPTTRTFELTADPADEETARRSAPGT